MYPTLAELRGPYLQPKSTMDYVHDYSNAGIDSIANPIPFYTVNRLRELRQTGSPNIAREVTAQTLMFLPSFKISYRKKN